jgi:voltage-gated sodium channel
MPTMSAQPRSLPARCTQVVRHRLFVGYIVATTILACALAGLETAQSLPAGWADTIGLLGDLVLASFTVELLLRIVAEQGELRRFFADPWHVFDAVVVAVGYVPLLLPEADGHAYLVLRAARIVWSVRLFEELPGLQRLINALFKSLPSIAWVFGFMFMHVYTYSVVGVALFREADPAHFGSLGEGMISMFEVLTVEGWPDVMRTVRERATVPDLAVVLFFISYLIVGAMVFLNLLVGILTDELRSARDAAALAERPAAAPVPAAVVADAELYGELERLESSLAALRERLGRPGGSTAIR